MTWTITKHMVYDSFTGDYVVLIRWNKEFNVIAKMGIEHICLIKDESILSQLLKRIKETKKFLIYVKRSKARNIIEDYQGEFKTVVYKDSVKDESESIKEKILSSIESIENEKSKKTRKKQRVEEDEKDEELDEEILST